MVSEPGSCQHARMRTWFEQNVSVALISGVLAVLGAIIVIEIIAAFDVEVRRGKQFIKPVFLMEELAGFAHEHGVKMAIVTVPATTAQEVTNQLVATGITGILNFAPIVLQVPEDVIVNNVNLAIELENLSYFIQG